MPQMIKLHLHRKKKMSAKVSGNIYPDSKMLTEIPLNKNNKAKRIRFYHNGNKFFNGIVVPVSSERYRSFDSLVTDLTNILTNKVILQHGVQNICSMEGRKIFSVNDLADGKEYVCCSKGEVFKKITYSNSPQIKTWQISNAKITTVDSSSTNSILPSCIKPRFIIIIRNGIRPRKIFRVFLNKRNAMTMEQVLQVLTDSAHLDTGAVRKVFNMAGHLIRKLEDIFDETKEGIFFVYGREKHTHQDFKLTDQENNNLQLQKKLVPGFNAFSL